MILEDLEAQPILTSHQRECLAVVADKILPRTPEMPSASDLDLSNTLVDKVLQSRPDLVEPLRKLLDLRLASPESLTLADLNTQDIETLFQVVAGAYYMDPTVRRLIGYDGQRALTLPRSGFGAEELLIEMMESPPRYRAC
ncbi:MAG: hypothetical protein KF874_15225 [Rhizobiaceae bacterium]|nr:hypothetical protein [Rhizobiaceae bacterium]